MKPSKLFRVVDEEKKVIECLACPRRCRIPDGGHGFCGVRWNFGGRAYLAVYGLAIAVAIDPIEKKPLYHFNPGSAVFSIATTGCTWACKYCQNWDISQRRMIAGWKLSPELVVKLAEAYGAHGITYTYNEPVVFIDYAYDIGVIAKKHGLFNTMVTNGYMSDETLDLVKQFIDAATVDVKGNGDDEFLQKFAAVPKGHFEYVLQAMVEMKRSGIFVEVTNLVVPRYGDDLEKCRKLMRWIVENLGPETPVHFLRFHPDYKMLDVPPTPVETLEKHARVAKEEGLHYVYIGNVPGHELENTYCPNCGTLVVRRFGFEILEWRLDSEFRCPNCGYKLNFSGRLYPTYRSDRFAYVPLDLYTEFVHVPESKLRELAERVES